jgi:hypothetical protein
VGQSEIFCGLGVTKTPSREASLGGGREKGGRRGGGGGGGGGEGGGGGGGGGGWGGGLPPPPPKKKKKKRMTSEISIDEAGTNYKGEARRENLKAMLHRCMICRRPIWRIFGNASE